MKKKEYLPLSCLLQFFMNRVQMYAFVNMYDEIDSVAFRVVCEHIYY